MLLHLTLLRTQPSLANLSPSFPWAAAPGWSQRNSAEEQSAIRSGVRWRLCNGASSSLSLFPPSACPRQLQQVEGLLKGSRETPHGPFMQPSCFPVRRGQTCIDLEAAFLSCSTCAGREGGSPRRSSPRPEPRAPNRSDRASARCRTRRCSFSKAFDLASFSWMKVVSRLLAASATESRVCECKAFRLRVSAAKSCNRTAKASVMKA
mmetsp:Transcript_29021/g.69355  ORF Transcript_29021/g.69355 Transcript_29021/m.69355 type:complete len:207 (+) Transcript_29021:218-838(+)